MHTSRTQAPDLQESLLPSSEDVQSYRDHGFWISPMIIPGEILDAAELGMRRYYDGDLDSTGVHPPEWRPAPGDGLRKDDYSSFCVDELAQLVRYPMIGATAARLSSASGIRLWHDQLLYKPVDGPGTQANVGWHTDRQYWTCCSSTEMLTAWVAFHDVAPEGGSVSFFDRSHTWDISDLDFFSQDLDGMESSARAQGFSVTIRPTTMKRGQVSFHHCRTVHGSGPNRSTEPRRSIAIHLQPTTNHVQVNTDGTIAPHRNNTLARRAGAVPDYADERIFPLLWGRP
ncbi:MAG TPA: phytanoyl-CoA dioxygenase family protein [Microlunatus sp.]